MRDVYASERKTRLAEEKADAEREVVHQKHLEEQRAEAAVDRLVEQMRALSGSTSSSFSSSIDASGITNPSAKSFFARF